jgi:hypothetical protein
MEGNAWENSTGVRGKRCAVTKRLKTSMMEGQEQRGIRKTRKE